MVEVEVLENEIAPLAERYGLSVYDIEVVSFGRPLLRVFAERNQQGRGDVPGVPGVTVGDLESFAKVLIPYLGMKNIFPREGHVEVSSPGLFRRLRRPEHFSAAVGVLSVPIEGTFGVGSPSPEGLRNGLFGSLYSVSARPTSFSDLVMTFPAW